MKATFPLDAGDIARLEEALDAPVQLLARAAYTLDQLIDEVVGPNPELLAVAVHKRPRALHRRRRMAELSELRTDDGAARTIAVESEDPERVIATVRELGLERTPERERAARAQDARRLRRARASRSSTSARTRSSSTSASAPRTAPGGRSPTAPRSPGSARASARPGRLGDEPIARTVAAIVAMVEEARRDGAEAIAAVGTAWMRMAPNSAAVVDAVRARTGVEIEVVDGEEEGRLAYLAASRASAWAAGRWSCSTPAAAARSSPSAAASTSTSASA